MEYSREILDHYNNPRNVGRLDIKDSNVITSILGNPDCGIIIKLQVMIGEDEIIKHAKFKAYGCGCAIASGSVLTEMILNKSVEEVERISHEDISGYLNLPFEKYHCSILAEGVLKEAIKKVRAHSGAMPNLVQI